MLIQCPECNKEISNKATACPNCGFPISESANRQRRKSNRRKRLPNGFGQITEIKGLRKPFRVSVTVGKNDVGRPICKLLKPDAYFKTYNDAYSALLEYNKKPYELSSIITMNELFERWFEVYSKKDITKNRLKLFKICWKYCSSVYDILVPNLRIPHIKYCLEHGTYEKNTGVTPLSTSMVRVLKTVFDLMLDYAIEYELTDKNYSRLISLQNMENLKYTVKTGHISFNDEELSILWDNCNDTNIQLILINCYTGFRPSELISITTNNVHLDEKYIIGGSKTKAGTNRVVPIHPKIYEFIKNFYSADNKYLFNNYGANKYQSYRKNFTDTIKSCDISSNHKPHDCRKTFVTLAKKHELNEYAIKYIVGHSITDITEKTYTDRDPEWLYSEILKIK